MKKLKTKQDLEDVANAIEQDIKKALGFGTVADYFHWNLKIRRETICEDIRIDVFREGEDKYLPAYLIEEFANVVKPYTIKYDIIFFDIDVTREIEEVDGLAIEKYIPKFEVHICKLS